MINQTDFFGNDPIRRWVETEMRDTALQREREFRALLQPKPTWMPEWLWRRAAARLVVLEEQLREVQK